MLALEPAFAGTICQMTPGGSLDGFQTGFYNLAQSFATNILPRVQNIYWLLWALWSGFELAFERLANLRLDKLLIWWFSRLFIAGLIYHIFLSPNFYMGILKFGAMMGSVMGGFAIDPTVNSLFGDYTPSAIMGINNCVSTAINNVHLGTFDFLKALELFFLQIAFLAVTGIAALYVMYMSIKMWLCLFAGFINTMFAGSRWTISWWQAYLGTVIKYALELMFTAALFGTVHTTMLTVVSKLSDANADIVGNYGSYLLALVSVFFLTYLMMTIPKEIASSLGGTFGSNMLEYAGNIVQRGMQHAANAAGITSGGGNSSNTSINTSTGSGMNNVNNTSQALNAFSNTGNKPSSSATSPGEWAKGTANVATKAATGQQWKIAADQIKKAKE